MRKEENITLEGQPSFLNVKVNNVPITQNHCNPQKIKGKSNQGRAADLKKSPLDPLVRGSDIFTTMEPYFGGLKSLCDIFYYMTLNIC